jgi:orotidine-5'-phosphate decarboxylase
MEPKEKIIVALDVDNPEKARGLVEQLAPHVGAFKIGLEFINSMLASLITPEHAWEAEANLREIRKLFELIGDKVFWDGKLMDIPNTIIGASAPLAKMKVKMFNVHCLGGEAMMKAALLSAEDIAKANGAKRPLVLGVTILTSLNYDDLVKLGIFQVLNISDKDELEKTKRMYLRDLVAHDLAYLAQESGLDGVIASPQEIQMIREYCQPELLVVTPGVRPIWAVAGDQKRVMTPGEAIKAGASYLVIGRPITKPPVEIGAPSEAAKRIAEEIASVM